MTQSVACYIAFEPTVEYLIPTPDANDYYLIIFVDIFRNERVDPEEPFQIYHNRGAPPADAIPADATGIDFIFGDENVPGIRTPSVTPTQTETPTVTPTATPTQMRCAADCDNSGAVTIDEVVLLLDRALDGAAPASCERVDADASGSVEIDEVVTAVNSATVGCPGTPGSR